MGVEVFGFPKPSAGGRTSDRLFLWGAFPLRSSGRAFIFSLGQSAIRRRLRKIARQHYDVFGCRKRNEHPQSTERALLVLSDGGEGAPFQSFPEVLGVKDFLMGRDSFSGS